MPSFMDIFLGVSQMLSGIYMIVKPQDEKSSNQEISGVVGDIKVDDKLQGNLYDVKTIDQRVKRVIEMINKGKQDPRVRAVAVKIVSRLCGDKHCIKERDYYGEVKAIFDWVRKYIRYVHDINGIDTFQHPARTLEFGGGDCDDYTILLASLYQSIGYPVRIRVVAAVRPEVYKNMTPSQKSKVDYNHIYLLVGIPPHKLPDSQKDWIPVDASVNKPFGWEVPKQFVAKSKFYKVE
jgi:transglutaminase-like putative cysteine protease